MERYDKAKRGKLLAWSGDHFVYRYGDSEVIKFSKFEFFLGAKGRKKAEQDYRICQTYFSDVVLPTRFVAVGKGTRVAKVQQLLTGHALRQEDMKRPSIRRQVEKILAAYANMVEKGESSIDLIGGHGVFNECLSNIFVTDDGNVYLIDTTLIELDDFPLIRWLVPFVRRYALARQHTVIRALLSAE